MGKRGRQSRGEYASKGATLSARITKGTRERLDAASKAGGLSLSQEVESRLRASLDEEDLLGGPVTTWMLSSVAKSIGDIEGRTGRRWYDDPYTFDECRTFIIDWMDHHLRPEGKAVPPQQTGRLAIPNPTRPSAVALQNAVSGLMLFMAAMNAKVKVPDAQASVVKRFGRRIKLTADQQKEMKWLSRQFASGAIVLNQGGTK
jgi:hypothetical protein